MWAPVDVNDARFVDHFVAEDHDAGRRTIWLPLVLPIGSIEPNVPREMHLACGLAFSGPLSDPRASLGIAAVRLAPSGVSGGEAAIGRIDNERRLTLGLAVIAPGVSRFAEECVVRVSNPRLSRKTRELLVGQGGPLTEIDRPLERHSQHRDA